MWNILFLFSACLLCNAMAENSEPRFIVIIPSQLKSGQRQEACVQLFYHKERVTLTATLEHAGQNSTILQGTAEANTPFSMCQEFEVPRSEELSLGYVTFSAKGDSINLMQNRNVAIKGLQNIIFIQTDKPVYKTAQTVLFKIVALQQDFRPANETYSVIYVKDPDGNRIFQWENIQSARGIAEGQFLLDEDPLLGSYTITAEIVSGRKVSQWITVEKYVLPKIKMEVNVPKTLTIIDEEFNVSVCANYTYGEPVQGNTKINVCRRNFRFYPEGTCNRLRAGICKEFTGELGSDGCFHQLVDTQVFQMERSGLSMSFNVEATLTENGTGVQVMQNAYVWISNQMTRLNFDYQSMRPQYRPGINYTGKFILLSAYDTPLANESVELEADGKEVGSYVTADDGSASFSLDTSNFIKDRIELIARYKKTEECNDDFWVMPRYPETFFSISRFYSRTGSFLQIESGDKTELKCGTTANFKVNYILNDKELGQDTDLLNFYHMVIAKGEIKLTGQTPKPQALTGSFEVSFPITPALAPSCHLVVYAISSTGDVIIDSIVADIEACLENKVSLNFSTTVAQPGSNVNVLLDAAPNSACAVRAVDQSIFLLRGEQELSPRTLYYKVPLWDFYGYWHGKFDLNEPKLTCVTPENVLVNGIEYEAIPSYGEGDAYQIITSTGLKFFGNFELQKPTVCEKKQPEVMVRGGGFSGVSSSKAFSGNDQSGTFSDVTSSGETVRQNFPETWIWTTQTVDANGKAQFASTVPDTITEWKANTFCMNEQVGIGISPPVTLTALQPFFVEPSLPYNIIRGEDFILRSITYSYLDTCIKVKTVLEPSEDFEVVPISTEEDNTGCFCGNERKTATWTFNAKALGKVNITISSEITHEGASCSALSTPPTTWRKDTVIRQLLVEAEGIEKEVSQSSLICAKDAPVSSPIQIRLPDNLVEGSARAYCIVLGDILGSTIQNIRNLVRMPYGCGEQNLITLVPNMLALDYLNATGQLTEKIRTEGIRNIQTGVQRHMQYRNRDGSYSIFREQKGTPVGNIWLTSFSYMSLDKAGKVVFIDPDMQKMTEDAISKRQREDGCFSNQGELLNSYLEGGVNSDASLTAYVALALLQSNMPPTHPVVRNALLCLETAMESLDDVYTEALMFYAFTLAGNEDKRSVLEAKLNAKAITEDGMIHWERPDKPKCKEYPLFYCHAPSAEIEITSYGLKAFLHTKPVTDETLQKSTQIARWIVQQQNPSGGFSSTQDTLVAVDALTQYASVTFTKDGSNQVRILSGNTAEHELQVSDGNRLVVQKRDLNVPGNYTAEISGNGCVFLQTSVHYNIKLASNQPSFDLSVTSPNPCNETSRKKFDLHINFRYIGSRNVSGMAILDITLISGYIADTSSLEELQRNGQISKFETPQSHVILYMMKVTHEMSTFIVSLELDYPIQKLQPRPMSLYDYYETDENVEIIYSHPCYQAESSS